MIPFTDFPDLASARLGGTVLWANDEFFAGKENLLRPEAAVWVPDRYTDRGKWMDGWETRRRRNPGNDSCLIALGLPGVVRGFDVDTSHFRGNFPEAVSIEGCSAPASATPARLNGSTTKWAPLLDPAPLRGDSRNLFPISCRSRITHLRLTIHPDGGVARLRVHGEVRPARGDVAPGTETDLAAMTLGGLVLRASNAFFGPPHLLLYPDAPAGMHDGWETRRQRRGEDWVILRLAARGSISQVVVDTSHFKGNHPDRCALEGCDLKAESLDGLLDPETDWIPILRPARLGPDRVHTFDVDPDPDVGFTHVRFRILPDGGVARLRLPGVVMAGEAG